MQHVEVYRHPERFAGWPANYGIWSWGDEIVVGFTLGYASSDPAAGFHARDASRPFVPMQARSLDGGASWAVAPTPCRLPGGRGFSADEHVEPQLQLAPILDQPGLLADCPGGIDFRQPGFALMCGRSGLGAGARSFFYVSSDRCRSWSGPYRLPTFGRLGVSARTDYLVSGRDVCTLFLTAPTQDGREGGTICVRTEDGGATFALRSEVGPEPTDGHAIMPASVRLSETTILVALRRSGRPSGWIDLYRSDDDAKTWRFLGRPVAVTGRGGNPPTLTKLRDGRLCITYGYRQVPFGLRAVLSEDDGATWSPPVTLRVDGGNHDIGYPRTVQRADGRLVTAYYYNDRPDGERYIAATIWSA